MNEGKWRFYVDRGGTFTDVIAEAPDGALTTLKLLSVNPDYDDATLEGIRRALGVATNAPIPAERIAEVRMGTTVATNALLERKGERVALVTTRGFRDALRIGYQNRPRLFDLHIVLPDMLYERVIEADERVGADGKVIHPLDEAALKDALALARAEGFEACAILFMHGYLFSDHERRAAEIARDLGFTQVSVSHGTVALQRFVSRGDTTVADAYLSPVLNRYSRRIADALSSPLGGGAARRAAEGAPSGSLRSSPTPEGEEKTRLLFMTSNGGLAAPDFFHGKDAIISGPAGGVVGMTETAREEKIDRVIGFDMGGTSTDVSRFDGQFERVYETEIAGVRLRVPMMAVNSIAAGGGSILHFEQGRFRVGPDSAGADPGPMCYRRNGPLTVTDANVMVGKLSPEFFPRVFGARGDQPIDPEVVRGAFTSLTRGVGGNRAPEDVADGFIRIAVENMAHAIRRISVSRGIDPRDYTLNCFGGAGGQHACLVADALGITRIFIHPFSGLLSAYGMKLANLRAVKQTAIGEPLNDDLGSALDELFATDIRRELREQLRLQGAEGELQYEARAHIRYEGSDTTVPIALDSAEAMTAAFAAAHARIFGFGFEGRDLIVESLEVEAVSTHPVPPQRSGGGGPPSEPSRAKAVEGAEASTELGSAPSTIASQWSPSPASRGRILQFYSQGAWHDAVVHHTEDLRGGETVAGPALLIEPHQTIVVEPGWRAETIPSRALILSRIDVKQATASDSHVRDVGAGGSNLPSPTDPVLLEVFANLFMAIAEEMGVTLQNTASSVNIKERLDFSCAIFDVEGGLVANAPHMPVHLGSMGDCVTAIISRHGDAIREGDAFATNAPYDGGTHLPDITVVAPVFVDGNRRSFVAARGHHADIGGTTPGSMPPFSKDIKEEGALFDGVRIVHGGAFDELTIREILARGEWPARNPDQNVADLKAQVASCARGIEELKRACTSRGADAVTAYMRHVQDNAEESVRAAIGALKDGAFEMPMDGDLVIKVKVTVDRATCSARVDFTGTSAQADNNLNAPGSVTKAAVLYVFRCLVKSDIPMNAGCLKPIEIVVPPGSLLNPRPPAAVAGGNVETSQAVVDALFGALGVMAASQGTMNNLTFGNERHQYYETICGGSGAGATFDGTAAVHTHMTNSRLTDPEVLEARYPVVLEEFGIRENSGGAGAHHGGDGAVRRIRMLEPMTAAVLSMRRETEPFGLAGGGPGARGKNFLLREDDSVEFLGGRAEVSLSEGDEIVIATPGGGGFGLPAMRK